MLGQHARVAPLQLTSGLLDAKSANIKTCQHVAVCASPHADEDASSSDGDDDGSECSHGSGSAGSFGTDEQEQEDDSDGADEGPSGSGSDAGDDGDLSSAGPASSTSAVTAGATVDGKSGQVRHVDMEFAYGKEACK